MQVANVHFFWQVIQKCFWMQTDHDARNTHHGSILSLASRPLLITSSKLLISYTYLEANKMNAKSQQLACRRHFNIQNVPMAP